MKAILAVAVCLLVVGCASEFEKGDMVNGKVGKIAGEPCRITVTYNVWRNAAWREIAVTARLETPECQEKRQ